MHNFDTGASQNVEQGRSKFIVYFALRVPIPMKQGEGVLCATGMGIIIYRAASKIMTVTFDVRDRVDARVVVWP